MKTITWQNVAIMYEPVTSISTVVIKKKDSTSI